jgi:3-oxoacyl-[acyl-carrier-protein] synthase-3
MHFEFRNKKISGISVVLPRNERSFLEEMDQYDFPRARSIKLKEVMGYDRHRLVDGDVCSSDLLIHGIRELVDGGHLDLPTVDALVVVTQTPDHLIPPTSMVIHGELGLGQNIFCVDIPQGCAGYIVGLIQAFLLLDQPAVERVLLLNSDVLSRKVSKRDRNSFPLIGDAASITLIERGTTGPIWANIQHDGRRRSALMIPAGGLRMPSNDETRQEREVGDHNYRSLDHLVMDGTGVFNFVMTEVPPMIESLFASAQVTPERVDSYFFHQPNQFILQKLAERLSISREKMPMNVVRKYGNSSGVTIPVAMVDNNSDKLKERDGLYCLAGFGVGLTWGSMLIDIGPLDFAYITEF